MLFGCFLCFFFQLTTQLFISLFACWFVCLFASFSHLLHYTWCNCCQSVCVLFGILLVCLSSFFAFSDLLQSNHIDCGVAIIAWKGKAALGGRESKLHVYPKTHSNQPWDQKWILNIDDQNSGDQVLTPRILSLSISFFIWHIWTA